MPLPFIPSIELSIESSKPPSAHVLAVGEAGVDQRLDNFLMRHLKGVPKTHIYRIIRSGEVRVNKGRASADTRLVLGDTVRLPPVRVSERAAEKAVAIQTTVPLRQFTVIHEDDHFLAINKPAGVAVHGGSGVSFGVIEQLRMGRPTAPYLELVHRLDRETSGILLVAKKRSALKALQEQFRGRTTDKVYLALALGTWPAKLKVLDASLHKYLLPTTDGSEGERRVKVVAADHPDAMRSLTLVKVARQLDGYALLEVTIKTGRTHQIRVHLAHAGHPIAGDDKYGQFEVNKTLAKAGLKRMYLHAWRLGLDHPATGERMVLNAALPLELSDFAAPL